MEPIKIEMPKIAGDGKLAANAIIINMKINIAADF
jgi:hypothetical protein